MRMKKNEIVSLSIKEHEYKFLAKTLNLHKDTIYKLKINDLLKNNLAKDINIVLSILKKSEVKPQPINQKRG